MDISYVNCAVNERGKKTRQTEEEVGRQHQAWSSPNPRGQQKTGKNGGN